MPADFAEDRQAPLDPFHAAISSRDADTLSLVRDALKVGRTRMAFQPIILASNQKMVAFYEGLIRLLEPILTGIENTKFVYEELI